MRNKKGFYTASRNMREAIEKGRKPYANIPQSLLKASGVSWKNSGVEWHHNGNRIAFFPSDSNDISKINKLILEIREVEKQKGELFYKTKKEAMMAVNELPACEGGELAIRLKKGKFGWFVCTNPLYYNNETDCFVKAKSIEQKEAIERLF